MSSTLAPLSKPSPGGHRVSTGGRRRLPRVWFALLSAGLATATGCHLVSDVSHAIPAYRLDPVLRGCEKESLAPLQLTALSQPRPPQHVVDAGDTLSVYVYGILPTDEAETPQVSRTQTVNQLYYPPNGTETGSRLGVPLAVEADGTLDLPLIGRTPVAGMTLPQISARLIESYRNEEVLSEGRERVSVQLLTPRVTRVTVMRQDSAEDRVVLASPQTNIEIRRGSGTIIDLPAYENDVLHALAATGGLPGTDAAREVWVIRGATSPAERTFLNIDQLKQWNRLGETLPTGDRLIDGTAAAVPMVTRIPLVGCPDSALPFTASEVILNDEDVLFVPRRHEYFIAGGMLPGARIPLPRDEDIDVLEAIAMATGSVGGPLAGSGERLQSGAPGYMREPTNVLILRTLADGRQLPIRVDLDRAMTDVRERILINDQDVVMIYFKPEAALLNGALNFTRFALVPREANDAAVLLRN